MASELCDLKQGLKRKDKRVKSSSSTIIGRMFKRMFVNLGGILHTLRNSSLCSRIYFSSQNEHKERTDCKWGAVGDVRVIPAQTHWKPAAIGPAHFSPECSLLHQEDTSVLHVSIGEFFIYLVSPFTPSVCREKSRTYIQIALGSSIYSQVLKGKSQG